MTIAALQEFYQQRINETTKSLTEAKQKHASLGWLRLLTIALPLLGIYMLWPGDDWVLIIIAIATLAIFLYLVAKASDAEAKAKHLERLIKINQNELTILNGKYDQQDDGAMFIETCQLPDNDLDLFGRASLFQYINRASSEQGKIALAKAFTGSTTRSVILQKQEAVKELNAQTPWRQDLQSYSLAGDINKDAEEKILAWMNDNSNNFDAIKWKILRWLVPVVSFTILGFYLADKITDQQMLSSLILVLAFVFAFYKKIGRQYVELSKLLPQLKAFAPLLACIEKANFESPWLKEQQQLLQLEKQTASHEISSLNKILQRFDYRLNPVVHIPLSIFLFWDLQQALALEKWRKAQTGHINHWFEAIGEMEMIASLASLSFNHPSWTFPEIHDGWFQLDCKNLGHPLIRENKLVSNDFSMHGPPCIALITGSNMAGKSTFLRSIGANMVLAMTGAPVRASYMLVPVVKTICSMRITDNLEEETSTFYAELKKIKRIVEAVQAGEKVFILVDEMLRGTNTLDRHKGSEALIRQLLRQHAVGIIASHDTALAGLEKEYPGKLYNYHFDSVIEKEEIVFDYLLKEGVCVSTNASLLMKKIGIELEA
jgi:hypothetical protein